MRTLIVTAFMSLDGVMEAPGGEPGYRNSGWTFDGIAFDEAAYALKAQEQEWLCQVGWPADAAPATATFMDTAVLGADVEGADHALTRAGAAPQQQRNRLESIN